MKIVFASLVCVVLSSSARAEEINYQSLNDEGFEGVSELLQSMTPAQRAAIVQQARKNQRDLQRLSPPQQSELLQQMHDISDTIAFDKIDPNKLDVSKTQGVSDIRKNLNTYQKKYSEKKIHNDVVIYPSGQ